MFVMVVIFKSEGHGLARRMNFHVQLFLQSDNAQRFTTTTMISYGTFFNYKPPPHSFP